MPGAGRTSALQFSFISALQRAEASAGSRHSGQWILAAVPGRELELLELQQGEAAHHGCKQGGEGKRQSGTHRVPPSSQDAGQSEGE